MPLYPFVVNFEILFRLPLVTTMGLSLGGYKFLSGIKDFH